MILIRDINDKMEILKGSMVFLTLVSITNTVNSCQSVAMKVCTDIYVPQRMYLADPGDLLTLLLIPAWG